MMRLEKDCRNLKKYPNSTEKDKLRTELICAIEANQKNKHYNFSQKKFHRAHTITGTSHWTHQWNVKNYQPNDPRWGSCKHKNRNVSIMNCSLLMPYDSVAKRRLDACRKFAHSLIIMLIISDWYQRFFFETNKLQVADYYADNQQQGIPTTVH